MKNKTNNEKTSTRPKASAKLAGTFFLGLWTFIKSLVLILLLTGSAVMIVGTMMLVRIVDEGPQLDIMRLRATPPTEMFDMNGDLIITQGEDREFVSFNDISPVMIDAILATEDARFFVHRGIDWGRMLAAQVDNVRAFLTGSLGNMQGGSTITQQLIKQSHLSAEQSMTRKLQEMYLSMQLEMVYSKEQILEAYLNFSPFGGNIHGVQRAAEFYFGKQASDLTLAEAATLAGIVQLPNVHRPDSGVESATNRRDTVLGLMVHHGYITEDMAYLAAAQPISDILVYQMNEVQDSHRFRPFIDAVFMEIRERFPDITISSGIRIHTTMDPEAQSFLYNLQNTNDILPLPDRMQSGIVFMETQTGQVRGIGGGTAEGELSFNWATQTTRQAGSTAKTLFSYGPAFQYLGWGTGTTLNDEAYAYDSGTLLRNWTRRYEGKMTIREAMDRSYNVPALKAFNAVMRNPSAGPEAMQSFVNGLGIPLDDVRIHNQSNPFGTFDVTPLQMAAAYAAFGNQGRFNEPTFIDRIELADGTVVHSSDHRRVNDQVMDEVTAYLTTSLLQSVMVGRGTGTQANVPGMQLAGKTGTTNFPAEVLAEMNWPDTAMRDSWFIGYSGRYTAAIWTGYETNQEGFITNQTQQFSWQLFNRVMRQLNYHPNGTNLPPRPEGVVSVTVEVGAGEDGEAMLASTSTPEPFRSPELFRSGTQPTTASTRFSQLETPQNFTGSISGTTLSFSWNHISNGGMDRGQLEAAAAHANRLAHGGGASIAELRNLSPTEAEARTLLRQIDAVGGTYYSVYGVTHDGQVIEIGATTDNTLSAERRLGEIIQFSQFYVVARFERFSGLDSERSNSWYTDGQIDPDSLLIPVPDMMHWSREAAEIWALENEVSLHFTEGHSDVVAHGFIIGTQPADQVQINGTLTVIISIGPEYIEPEPEPEPEPNPEPQPGPDEGDGYEPDQPSSGPGEERHEEQSDGLIDRDGFPALAALVRNFFTRSNR